MRPTTSSTCASACSCVSFSFLTRRASCPAVTLRASVRPASTKSCLTSLRTTGMPAAAMVWAIWPPMVPAPTTAALNTNMYVYDLVFRLGTARKGIHRRLLRQLLVGAKLAGEALDGPAQRVADGPADEQEVHDDAQRAALLERVLDRQRDRDLAVAVLEGHPLDPGHARVVDVGGLPEPGLVLGHPLDHPAAAGGRRLPHERGG